MILVDVRETPSVRASDIFLQILPGKDFEVISALRALLKDQPVDAALVSESGLTMDQLRDLVQRLKSARLAYEFRRHPDVGRRTERTYKICLHAYERAR